MGWAKPEPSRLTQSEVQFGFGLFGFMLGLALDFKPHMEFGTGTATST